MSGAERFDAYLSDISQVAKIHFFPGERYHGKDGQLKFVRESFAHLFILNGYTDKEVKDNIGKCYGCLVRCVFGTGNKLHLDAKDVVKEIRSEIQKHQDKKDRARGNEAWYDEFMLRGLKGGKDGST